MLASQLSSGKLPHNVSEHVLSLAWQVPKSTAFCNQIDWFRCCVTVVLRILPGEGKQELGNNVGGLIAASSLMAIVLLKERKEALGECVPWQRFDAFCVRKRRQVVVVMKVFRHPFIRSQICFSWDENPRPTLLDVLTDMFIKKYIYIFFFGFHPFICFLVSLFFPQISRPLCPASIIAAMKWFFLSFVCVYVCVCVMTVIVIFFLLNERPKQQCPWLPPIANNIKAYDKLFEHFIPYPWFRLGTSTFVLVRS